jgi:hypothetical protein
MSVREECITIDKAVYLSISDVKIKKKNKNDRFNVVVFSFSSSTISQQILAVNLSIFIDKS